MQDDNSHHQKVTGIYRGGVAEEIGWRKPLLSFEIRVRAPGWRMVTNTVKDFFSPIER